ncbi:probable serine/threonine-protein kinase roco5 isoform X1 [Tanacetum coccineum]
MASAPVIGTIPSMSKRGSGSGAMSDSQRGKIKFLCSSGGKILPRPSDGKLRYVGGETHIFIVPKNLSFDEFVKRTSEFCNQPHTIKYQLPGEDLDALISVASNEDLQNMIEEYNGLGSDDGSSRLRIFLVPLMENDSTVTIETSASLQSNPDYHYVAAVNGIIDDGQLKSSLDKNLSLPVKHSPPMENNVNNSNVTRLVSDPPTLVASSDPSLVSPALAPPEDLLNGYAQVYSDPLSDSIEIPILKGRAFHSENRILPPSDQVNPYVASNESQLGIPHAFSDPQLQERGSNSAFGSQDGSNFPSTLRFAPPPLPSSFLQGKSAEQRDSSHPQVHFEIPNVNPSAAHGQTDFRLQNEPPFYQGGNFGLQNGLSNVNHDQISARVVDQPLHNLQVPNVIPASTTTNVNPISNAVMQPITNNNQQQMAENQQQVYIGTNNNNISDADADRSLNDLLSHLSDVLKSEASIVQPSSSRQKESNVPSIPTTGGAEVKPEVKFTDKNFNYTEQLHANLGHEESHSKTQMLGDGTGEAIPTSVTETECTPSNFSSQDAATENECKDGPFSNALIAEMEADMHGIQIIKNAELEELKELGAGTYGTVYHGRWRGSDVAIKRIKKSCFSGRASEQERLTNDFWREAKILSNLHHPNVVAFYGVVPDGAGGTLATVTEFMTHGSLRNVLIKKGSLDCRRKLIIAMDAAFGMEYLHMKNIVHFDLKCDNLLVNMRDPQRPICKVGDFGLSRIKRNTLVSGGVRGTLPWMAPELLNGNTTKVSEKVDVFSFGITLWEILTGEEPYANMHCGAIIGGIVKDTLRPKIPEQCDPEWKQLMEQCWLADPTLRPSFTEITNRLRIMSKALQANGKQKSQQIVQ